MVFGLLFELKLRFFGWLLWLVAHEQIILSKNDDYEKCSELSELFEKKKYRYMYADQIWSKMDDFELWLQNPKAFVSVSGTKNNVSVPTVFPLETPFILSTPSKRVDHIWSTANLGWVLTMSS